VDPRVVAAGIFVTGQNDPLAVFRRDEGPGTESPPRLPPEAAQGHEFEGGRLRLYCPIRNGEEPVGRLVVECELRELRRRLVGYLGIVGGVLALSLVAARATAAGLERSIARPIAELAALTERVSRNEDYGIRARTEGAGELAVLVQGFNEMLARIQAREEELRCARQELERRVEERTRELEQEIQERLRAERELQRQARELARSNAELEQFAYAASHDLQEPLRMVGSYVDLLARRYRGRLDADADEFIAYALDGVARMQALIRDLLAYSRLETRGRPPELVDCEAVVAECRENLRSRIEESGAEIRQGPLPKVRADPSQLLQLFQNLLGNALKFRGAEPPRIRVFAERIEGGWRFAVADNGIGIEPEHRERIFQIFQRVHSRQHYPGTGIGLAICKKIVERHGGRIWVESEPGRGSTFFFTWPDDGPGGEV
jgi:signal transduction histidine kinase